MKGRISPPVEPVTEVKPKEKAIFLKIPVNEHTEKVTGIKTHKVSSLAY